MAHAVALIPGLLGFDHDGAVTYFADRFLAGLRAAIEAVTDQSVLVVPVGVPAIGSLAARQAALLVRMNEIDARGGPFEWHLVGHSTGGLDAALLARTTRLVSGPQGSEFSTEPLSVERLRSITTIAAPHHGSCATLAPLSAATMAGDVPWRVRLRGLLEVPSFAIGAIQRDALRERLSVMRGAAGRDVVSFLTHVLLGDELLRDLHPRVASTLTRREDNRRADVPIFSIATMTPPATAATEDHLFRLLWTWTQLEADRVAAPPPLGEAPGVVIADDVADLPSDVAAIDARANDGVVNTNRQVVGTFAALVSADHRDVIGRYRRIDLVDGSIIDPGLFTSGAKFDDRQFFELLRVVARGIASAMSHPPDHRPRTRVET